MATVLRTHYLFITLKALRPISSKVYSELFAHLRAMKVTHKNATARVDEVEGIARRKLRLRIEIVDPILPNGWRQNELLQKFCGELGKVEIDPGKTGLKIADIWDN